MFSLLPKLIIFKPNSVMSRQKQNKNIRMASFIWHGFDNKNRSGEDGEDGEDAAQGIQEDYEDKRH